jgi:hypothetical protein
MIKGKREKTAFLCRQGSGWEIVEHPRQEISCENKIGHNRRPCMELGDMCMCLIECVQ